MSDQGLRGMMIVGFNLEGIRLASVMIDEETTSLIFEGGEVIVVVIEFV